MICEGRHQRVDRARAIDKHGTCPQRRGVHGCGRARCGRRSQIVRLDWSEAGRAAALARIRAPVRELSTPELAAMGLDAETLAACRRRRGYCFDSRIEQLVQAKLLLRVHWDRARGDERIEVATGHELGRSVLAAAFGPANRARLEVYWDAIHELGGRRFWLYDFMGAFLIPACHAPPSSNPERPGRRDARIPWRSALKGELSRGRDACSRGAQPW